jgi:histidyl-tRNA synthetase
MAKNRLAIQAIRGMHDVLPEQTPLWHYVEHTIRDVLSAYSYQEIRLPIVEKTALFKRAIGEITDIVEKEMYSFDDRNGDSLTLRPEGTAGCLRACLEHGLLHNQVQRLWYLGPMFRHERPQKGRYRQFYQLGVETYGMASAAIDTEIITLATRLWKTLGIDKKLQLQLNSLGTLEERARYREKLIDYFNQYQDQLDEDSVRRLKTNPLRILDTKNSKMDNLVENAPSLMDYLGDDSRTHFQTLTDNLDSLGIHYQLNPRLVRGLDYYGKTVFEWVTDALGSQGTVCAGGRYDSLIEQLGGRTNYAIGFALGMERLLSLVEVFNKESIPDNNIDVYMIRVGEKAEQQGLILAENIRDQQPKLRLQVDCNGGSFKSQFKKADKSGAKFALIIGEEETDNYQVAVKYLRETKPQVTLSYEDVINFLIQDYQA